MATYSIVRFRFRGEKSVIKTRLTLEEAQEHCSDPESSSKTAENPEESGMWFDGYTREGDDDED